MSEKIMSEEQAQYLAKQVGNAASHFTDGLREKEPSTYFDAFGISLIIKEWSTFNDILILVEHRRLDGAQARLRSVWESLVILKYVIHCASNTNLVAEALYLFGEYKNVNIMQENGYWKRLSNELQNEKQEMADAFKRLPEDIQEFVKRPIEQMHNKIKKCKPSALQKVEVGSTSISQYDAIFRTSSMFVHGGLSGTHIQVKRWLGKEKDVAREEFNATGILTAASLWLVEVIEAWLDNSTDARYKTFWAECTAGLEVFTN